MEKGYAYAASNGDVYYAVAKFEPYGQLSVKRLADLDKTALKTLVKASVAHLKKTWKVAR